MKQFQNLEELEQWRTENEYDDMLIFADPDYASAVIGISETGTLIYSHEKMVEWLMQNYELSETDAIEFIETNTIQTLAFGSGKCPVILYEID